MAQIQPVTPPSHTKAAKRNIPREPGTETDASKKKKEDAERKISYNHARKHRQTHNRTVLDPCAWFAAEGRVREAPGRASVLETVTMLFPASRSLAVPLSARGLTLHFSNAQTTQFWHLYSVQSTSYSQPSLATNSRNKNVLQFGSGLNCLTVFPSPLFIFHASPSHPPPLIFRILFSFNPPWAVCLKDLWSRLNQREGKPNTFSCLFAVYINESFMCWVYRGAIRWCLRGAGSSLPYGVTLHVLL